MGNFKDDKFIVASVFDNFLSNCESVRILEIAGSYAMKAMDKYHEIEKKDIIELFDDFYKDLKLTKEQKEKINVKDINSLIKSITGLSFFDLNYSNTFYKSIHVMLMSIFDFMISDLISAFYKTFSGSLSNKEILLEFGFLNKFNNLNEIKEYFIYREVEKISYKNLDDKKNFIKNYLNIDIEEDLINWDILREATERRNIIVHNNSVVNKKYLSIVNDLKLPEKVRNFREKDNVVIDLDYFENIFNEVFIAGFILSQNCWRSWKSDDIKLNFYVGAICMKYAIDLKKWRIAEIIGFYSDRIKDFHEKDRRYIDFSLLLSLKNQGKIKEFDANLKRIKKSKLSSFDKIILYVITNKKKDVIKYIKEHINDKSIKEEKYKIFYEPFLRPYYKEINDENKK